jgi:histidine triad (HIT) family protein
MNEECLFCQVYQKKIPSYMLAENDYCLAFLDINPISEGHVLIITKKHYENIAGVEPIY